MFSIFLTSSVPADEYYLYVRMETWLISKLDKLVTFAVTWFECLLHFSIGIVSFNVQVCVA